MGLHKIKKGLDLPLAGAPEQRIVDASQPSRVALLGPDYPGLRPTVHVAVGERVRRGQLLFEDKKLPGVRFTSPAAGSVAALHRGEKRTFQSVVIQVDSTDSGREGDQVSFASYTGSHPTSLGRSDVRDLLVESGLWTALRARPFGRVADPGIEPHSVFVTASDSHPLAADPDRVLQGRESDFERGLVALSKLTDGPVFVCKRRGSAVEAPNREPFRLEEFSGPHPAGTAGLHIHTLDPVSRGKVVWQVGYQDVVAMGILFGTGRLDVARVVALSGPAVLRPRLLRSRLGAALEDLVAGELASGENRVVSGSVLSGRTAQGEVLGYLGRYHQQVSVLPEGRKREFLGWLGPGINKFSTANTYLGRLIPGRKFALDTSTQGSPRAIVPIGLYERIMPMDLMPSFLLKALVTGDVERAEELGCLELVEEDLALCTFVCPGKVEYGPYLRDTLSILEQEG